VEIYRSIAAVFYSVYPICPSKLDKREPASILLNELIQKRVNVSNVTLKIQNDDSG
jgi:hypothetical protein